MSPSKNPTYWNLRSCRSSIMRNHTNNKRWRNISRQYSHLRIVTSLLVLFFAASCVYAYGSEMIRRRRGTCLAFLCGFSRGGWRRPFRCRSLPCRRFSYFLCLESRRRMTWQVLTWMTSSPSSLAALSSLSPSSTTIFIVDSPLTWVVQSLYFFKGNTLGKYTLILG